MKKFYSLLLALMVSVISSVASAGDYQFTIIVDHPENLSATMYYADYELVEGENIIDPDFSWITLSVNPANSDYYIVSCLDEDGNPPMRYGEIATNYYGGYTFDPAECVGKTFTIISSDVASAPRSKCYVTVDQPEKIKMSFKTDRSDYFDLVAAPERNEIEFIAGLQTPIYFLPRGNEYNTPVYQVMVDGVEIFPTNKTTHEYAINPVEGSEINITYAFPDVEHDVTVELPEGTPIDAIESIFLYYEDTKTPVEPALSLKVPAGNYVEFNIADEYKFMGYQFNDNNYETVYSSTSARTEVLADTKVFLDVRPYEMYDLTLTLVDPSHVIVQREIDTYGYDLETYSDLQAGDNQLRIPEGYSTLRIYPSSRAIIKSVKDETDYEYSTGWYDYYKITVNSEGPKHVIVDSEGYSNDPVHVSFACDAEGVDFLTLVKSVTNDVADGYYYNHEPVEFDETGFEALPGNNYTVNFNTDDYNVSKATYTDATTGDKDIFSWGSSSMFQVIGGGEIKIDAKLNEPIEFTLTINDPDHVKVYQGNYSSYYPENNVEITGFEAGVAKELAIRTSGSNIQITLIPDEDYYARAYNKTDDITLDPSQFYVSTGTDVEVTIGQYDRSAEAILFIKDRATADTSFRMELLDRTELPGEFEEGYNVMKFDPIADTPIKFSAYGNDFWSDEVFIYLNDVYLPNEAYYGFYVMLPIKPGDVVKMFLNEDSETEPEMHDVTIEHEGDKNFTVKKDFVTEVADLATKAHAGTRFDVIPAESHEIEVTVNDVPVELAEGAHTFTIDGPAVVKVTENQSGIGSIAADANAADNDVYNLQGIKVISNATPEQIKALPAGLYIKGGEKIVVK